MSFNYIGLARNNKEKNEALSLASLVFINENDLTYSKSNLLSVNGNINNSDVVILKKNNENVCGCCFLIDRFFVRNNEKIKGTFFSSICIAESERGNSFSIKMLKEAIRQSNMRNSKFSILIARRAVDYFYNKLSFWGISQYSKILISKLESRLVNKNISFKKSSAKDIKLMNSIYEKTYLNSFGPCIRNENNWNYILKKSFIQNVFVKTILIEEKFSGYIIFSKNIIYEIALVNEFDYIDVLNFYSATFLEDEDLLVHCSERHLLIKELSNSDFTLQKRQCSYGGHMVRVNTNSNSDEISFQKTCDLMGVKYLSSSNDGKVSFNLLLSDHV
jgi:predicted acetyltransferase